jgi:hypothetical protein
MARQRDKRRRKRPPLGHLTPEHLLAHRELEFLRVAGQPRPRTRGAHHRHSHHLERRALKLLTARQLILAAESLPPAGR